MQLKKQKAVVEKYTYAIERFNELNITTLASFIVGFPGETEESVLNTIELCEKYPTTYYQVWPYYHDNFAPINDKRDHYDIKDTAYSWEHKTMDWQEACYWAEHMIKNIN